MATKEMFIDLERFISKSIIAVELKSNIRSLKALAMVITEKEGNLSKEAQGINMCVKYLEIRLSQIVEKIENE